METALEDDALRRCARMGEAERIETELEVRCREARGGDDYETINKV
jgi:hypothetical protein